MSAEDTPELAYDISQCVHRADLVPEALALWDGTALPGLVLRRLADGSLRSALATPAQGWQATSARADGALTQLFVLEGQVRIGKSLLGPCGFAVLPGDRPLDVEVLADSEWIVIVDAPVEGTSPEPVLHADCRAIDPFVPVIEGRRLDGFERRVLWLDPRSGADTRLLKVPPRFGGVGGGNWHPVEEEIFCIEGDIQPDDTRPMKAGSFLWNPARSIHGFNERTEGGCMLLEWHDGPWDLHLA
ncbi:cupin domain-containing protein [Novosphingobium sp. MBES04]|uniref:cupin domain-containing protein n=1 Tax=Novosphingobium sp. MBES04 TaxID=1206458 RepID=UPI00057C36DA|nr:hypothetical protein [Novosphingobium sp. MBES04]GAM05431.1 hypothetical protein MBENS4_2429 [Novosphingobium sp. MBES04]